MPKRYILSIIYFARAALDRRLYFAAGEPGRDAGFRRRHWPLWLSTVPPTSALVAVMFGTRWLAMLFGFAFFSHQVGGFLGVLLGGFVFERTGSYNPGLVAFGAVRRDFGASSTCPSSKSRSRASQWRPPETLAQRRGSRHECRGLTGEGRRGGIQGNRHRESGRRHQGSAR